MTNHVARKFNGSLVFLMGDVLEFAGTRFCDCRIFSSGFYCWLLIFGIIRESRLLELPQFGFSLVNYLKLKLIDK